MLIKKDFLADEEALICRDRALNQVVNCLPGKSALLEEKSLHDRASASGKCGF